MSGGVAFFGRFQSLTVSVRDATETYLELGARIPIYLNGEIQIAWVLEQGLVDMSFIVKTFGVKHIRRDQVLTRGPRFQIAFDANAAELVNWSNANQGQQKGESGNWLRGQRQQSNFVNSTTAVENASSLDASQPQAAGRYEMQRCKVDSVSLGIMPGRRVAAVRWEGVSEGISYLQDTVQTFKDRLLQASNPTNNFRTVSGNPPSLPTEGTNANFGAVGAAVGGAIGAGAIGNAGGIGAAVGGITGAP